jgi:cytochrome d ubiquinol oxidase subunit II
MLLQALPLVFVLVGLVLYAVLGGADFGAGFWQLFAGQGRRGRSVREHAHRSIGPVWEANHVWLIFVITVFWTAYPKAFASIASTLSIPLFIAAIGIIFRGATYALRAGASSARESGVIDTVFALSSILTPFALGAAVGAIATGRVPVGNSAGHAFSSWLNPAAITVGVLAVSNSAFLAAVYLAADANRLGHRDLERDFRVRALIASAFAGGVAIAGLFVLDDDNHSLFRALVRGDALVAVIVSAAAGFATLALVHRRRYSSARCSAATAVAAIIAGWALARWPTILPHLTIAKAAAGHDTLLWITVVVLAGGALVFPALALLFRLAVTGRLQPSETVGLVAAARQPQPRGSRLPARAAAATLIAGVGLLTFADASWAQAIGLVCLLCFAIAAFIAVTRIAFPAESPAVDR